MAKDKGNIFTFGIGLISGVVTGVILGLLSAPKAGEDTRDNLSHRIKEFKERAKDKLADLQEISKDGVSRVKNNLQHRAQNISSKLDELAKRGSDVLVQDEVQ